MSTPAESRIERILERVPGFVYHCRNDERWSFDYLSDRLSPDGDGSEPTGYLDLIHPEDSAAVIAAIRQAVRERSSFDLRYRLMLPGGGEHLVADRGCPRLDPTGALQGLAGFITLAPEPAPEGEVASAFRPLLEASEEALGVMAPGGAPLEVNDAALRLFGCPSRQLFMACLPGDLSPATQPDGSPSAQAAAAAIATALARGSHDFRWQLQRLDNGAGFTTRVTLTRIAHRGGAALLVHLRPIDDSRGADDDRDDRLRQLAYEDPLTGLPNRQAALQWLDRGLDQGLQGALLIFNLDIDNFQWVNNTFGRDQADHVIRVMAEVLVRRSQPGDLVARLQSDEFLLIQRLPAASPADHPQPESLLQALRRSLADALEQRRDLPYIPGFCVGCRHVEAGEQRQRPCGALNAEALLLEANTALSEARRSGVNRQAVYRPEMSRLIQRQMQLESRLTEAQQLQEFTLHYQPIVRRDGVIVAAEALMRWPQADGTFIPPGQFIPLLEKTGRIREVGRWLIDASCEQLARWQARGLQLEYLSINISAAQLLTKEAPLHQQLMQTISRLRLPARALLLEITETAVLENLELARIELDRLTTLGFGIALDDFGTGYSSLLTLLQLPISALKIDKTFVDGIERQPKSIALVETCVSMADKLGLRCIAEGIESELQCQKLRRIGCQYFQGYLYDRPLPPAELEQRLQRQQQPAGILR